MTTTPAKKPLSPERAEYLKWRSKDGAIGPLILMSVACLTQSLAMTFASENGAGTHPNTVIRFFSLAAAIIYGTSAIGQAPWAVLSARVVMMLLVVLGLAEPFMYLVWPVTVSTGGLPMFSTTLPRVMGLIASAFALTGLLWSRTDVYREFLAYVRAKASKS